MYGMQIGDVYRSLTTLESLQSAFEVTVIF